MANDQTIVRVPAEPTAEMLNAGYQHTGSAIDTYKAMIAARPRHDNECADDPYARSVCEGMYAERTDELLGLVEALLAIRALVGGHNKQSRAVTKIVDDAIEEHAAWTR
jgi:hypothetical protein